MISVLLPVYNEPIDYIKKSVQSILEQTYTDLELLVIVDKPDRYDVFDYLENEKNNDSRIRIIKNGMNLGLTASLNKGIKLAKGCLIARMDADDISLKDRLEKQLVYIEKYDLDIVGGAITNMTQDGVIKKEMTIYFPANTRESNKLLKYNTAAAHPTWLVKKSLFEKYNYIDYPACEDYEFLTRIALDGYKIGNVPEVVLYYRMNESGISNSRKPYQKTSLAYIRGLYCKGQSSNIEKFDEYINSKKGKKAVESARRYYEKLAMAKQKNGVSKIITMLSVMFCNGFAISQAYSSIRSRIMRASRRFKEPV